MKFLRTWMGVVTGSMAGRDDGYPEQKYSHGEELTDVAGTRTSEHGDPQYFKLVPVSAEDVARAKEENREAVRKNDLARAERAAETAQQRLEVVQRQQTTREWRRGE